MTSEARHVGYSPVVCLSKPLAEKGSGLVELLIALSFLGVLSAGLFLSLRALWVLRKERDDFPGWLNLALRCRSGDGFCFAG